MDKIQVYWTVITIILLVAAFIIYEDTVYIQEEYSKEDCGKICSTEYFTMDGSEYQIHCEVVELPS